MSSTVTKVAVSLLAGATFIGTLDEASAVQRNRYTHSRYGGYGYGYGYGYRHHRGIGVGGLGAGAALGIIGAATAGAVANRYYNGYPAYGYEPDAGYGYQRGYDYHPSYGYYGPY